MPVLNNPSQCLSLIVTISIRTIKAAFIEEYDTASKSSEILENEKALFLYDQQES